MRINNTVKVKTLTTNILMFITLSSILFSCGISPSSSIKTIPANMSSSTSTTTTQVNPDQTVSVNTYFVLSSSIVQIVTRVPPPIDPGSLITLIMSGSYIMEQYGNLSSFVTLATYYGTGDISNGTASVVMTGSFLSQGSQVQLLEVAQIVLTLNNINGIKKVQFLSAANLAETPTLSPILVPTSNNGLQYSVSASDYSSLVS